MGCAVVVTGLRYVWDCATINNCTIRRRLPIAVCLTRDIRVTRHVEPDVTRIRHNRLVNRSIIDGRDVTSSHLRRGAAVDNITRRPGCPSVLSTSRIGAAVHQVTWVARVAYCLIIRRAHRRVIGVLHDIDVPAIE
jgi:hypothetical protein